MGELHPSTEKLTLNSQNLGKKARLAFGLFAIFFIYYIVCAIIQTPGFQDIASIPFAGMPLGFVLSMGVFPVSWIILVIFFIMWR